MKHEDVLDFLQQTNLITDNQRNRAIYLIELLKEKEVFPRCIEYLGRNKFNIIIPILAYPNDYIEIQFGCLNDENWLSCGPSSTDCTNESIDFYIDWLDKHMPRREMTAREVIEAGNPDNLIIPEVFQSKKEE